MRVMECNVCGETLAGANDDDLLLNVQRHMQEQHTEAGLDEEQLGALVRDRAYDATDS